MNLNSMIMNSICIRSMTLLLVLSALAGCKTGLEKEGKGEQIKDVDGNFYNTVQIGTQVWMAENLKTTGYSDATPIPLVENYDEWADLTLPAYCWYNNDSLNREDFGALYNWYVVESGKLCPDGWHIPTDEEWLELETSYGGRNVAGGSLKESGTTYWKKPNEGASKEGGFAARPGGYRSYTGTFNLMRTHGFWWTSTEKGWYGAPSKGIYRGLRYNYQGMHLDIAENTNGFSVRCVKNQ